MAHYLLTLFFFLPPGVALVRDRSLRSLRCLTAAHLPLLRRLRQEAGAALQRRYGVRPDQLRAFLHVPPSYYHLHVHFTHADIAHQGTSAGRAHLLDDVIDNLTLFPDYYQRCSFTCALP